MLKNLLNVFSFRNKQDLLTLLIKLRDNNISYDQIIEYLDNLKEIYIKNIRTQNIDSGFVFLCPECNNPMNIFSVNQVAGDQVGGNLKSQWLCAICGYSIYNQNSVNEELSLLIKEKS